MPLPPQREEARSAPGWPACALDTALLRACGYVQHFPLESAGGDETAAGRLPAEKATDLLRQPLSRSTPSSPRPRRFTGRGNAGPN